MAPKLHRTKYVGFLGLKSPTQTSRNLIYMGKWAVLIWQNLVLATRGQVLIGVIAPNASAFNPFGWLAFCPSSPPTQMMFSKTRGRQTREENFHQEKFFINWADKNLGTTVIEGTEDCHLGIFSGVYSVEVFLMIWHLIIGNNLHIQFEDSYIA